MNVTAPKSPSCVCRWFWKVSRQQFLTGYTSEIQVETHTGVEGVGEFVENSVEPRRSIGFSKEGVPG
jgi:hypothetical protein